MIDATPAATGVASPAVSRCARITAMHPLAPSRHIAATALRTPLVRRTFDAPTFPLPTRRKSIPRRRASTNANGTDPTRYAITTASNSCI